MGATASEKALPHHAPGSLPCQPRLCRARPRGRPPPLHRPPPHLLRPLCHLPRPHLQDRICRGEGTELRDQARDRVQRSGGAQPQNCDRRRLPERHHSRVHPLHRHHPSRPCRCLLRQEGGRGRPPSPRWSRPYNLCHPLPQLRQQGHRGVLPSPKVEPTTVTEQSCLLKGEVECTEVVVATIPRVTCSHAEHTKPAEEEAVETE